MENRLPADTDRSEIIDEAILSRRWKIIPSVMVRYRIHNPEKLPKFYKQGMKTVFILSEVIEFEVANNIIPVIW